MPLRRMCILLLLDGMFSISLLELFGLNIVQVQCFLIDFLSRWSNHCWKRGFEMPISNAYYYCIVVLQICYYLLNIFRFSNIGCIFIYNCYVFLMNLPLYHYIMASFISCYSFWLKFYFVWCKYSYPCSLLVYICVEYLLLSLHFESVCVLEAEVSLL